MPDFLDYLARCAKETVKEGYYNKTPTATAPHSSLKNAILKCGKAPIIAEIKFASPSLGAIRDRTSVSNLAADMEEGGAAGISVLTEPKNFGGDIRFLVEARKAVGVPVLMKDIVLNPVQVDAASKAGANAILLIQALFDRGYCKLEVDDMIDYSHSKGLEVLLEVHTVKEYFSALRTDADMIGINNRDLTTLKVDLEVTRRLLATRRAKGKVIVSESGVKDPEDIRLLRSWGTQGFLVGTAIMKAYDVKAKVAELVNAL